LTRIYSEEIQSAFEGTIIDLETIGELKSDEEGCGRYRGITPVIFGFIHKDGLEIHCATDEYSIPELRETVRRLLPQLKRPFYAFNAMFESSVLSHFLGQSVRIDGELNRERFEAKRYAVKSLGIPNYEDPFYDSGRACMGAWLRGDIENAVLHNRSCLLKERDILLRRGFREPDALRTQP